MQVNYEYFQPLEEKLSYMSPKDLEEVKLAYAIAYEGHDGQTRSSGLPYITHPVAVAGILADLTLDVESIQAALLHDVIEDTKFTYDDLARLFGENVAYIVNGVTKLDKLKFRTRQEAEVANFRKMILSMTKDVRIVLIKLADRTHNMRTIGALRPDKQRRIAKETLDIYAPLAYRLGVMKIKRELDFLSFRALYPVRFEVIERAYEKASKVGRRRVVQIQENIAEQIQMQGIKGTVHVERLTALNIYNRLLKKQNFKSFLDVHRFIIKTDTQDECYRVLGIIHSLFKPVPHSFQDFIALPKINGYQSLTTELLSNVGEPIEVFIRTRAMDEVAELGITSTLTYTPNSKNIVGQERIQQWLESLSELQHVSVNSIEFNNSVKQELFPEDIFVFTPRGKIIELPQHSTALDFAYYIHSTVGQHAESAIIDGRDVPISTPLKPGQTVEIITNPDVKPSEAQLSDVRSTRAKARLREALKEIELENYIVKGQEILERVIGKPFAEVNKLTLVKALEFFNLKSLNDLFAEVCFGNIITPVVRAVLRSYERDAEEDSQNILSDLQNGTLHSDLSYKELLDRGLNVRLRHDCFITPGDEVMVVANYGQGLLLESRKSPIVNKRNYNSYQHLNLEWGYNPEGKFPVQVRFVLSKHGKDAGKDAADIDEELHGFINSRFPTLETFTKLVKENDRQAFLVYEVISSNKAQVDEFISTVENESGFNVEISERVFQ